MKGLLVACRFYVLFLAVFGLFFGQLYFASFKIGSTMAGAAGIAIGSIAGNRAQKSLSGAWLVVGLCVMGLLGVGIDAFEYYSKYDIPGNDFGWFLRGPYCAALLFLSLPAMRRMFGHTS